MNYNSHPHIRLINLINIEVSIFDVAINDSRYTHQNHSQQIPDAKEFDRKANYAIARSIGLDQMRKISLILIWNDEQSKDNGNSLIFSIFGCCCNSGSSRCSTISWTRLNAFVNFPL